MIPVDRFCALSLLTKKNRSDYDRTALQVRMCTRPEPDIDGVMKVFCYLFVRYTNLLFISFVLVLILLHCCRGIVISDYLHTYLYVDGYVPQISLKMFVLTLTILRLVHLIQRDKNRVCCWNNKRINQLKGIDRIY